MDKPVRQILFNQGAGNSREGQWGYGNRYSGLTALDFNPIWSDNIHQGGDPNSNDTTSPCHTPAPNGYKFDHGRLQISMAAVPTPSRGNAVMLTNEYTYQHQVSQYWSRWYAEQAFYLNKAVARAHNLRVFVTHTDDTKEQIDPFNGLDPQAREFLWGKGFPSIKYAVLVWNIKGQDIGVAIDARRQPDLALGRLGFHASLMRQDNDFSCKTGADQCGVFEWHTYICRSTNLPCSRLENPRKCPPTTGLARWRNWLNGDTPSRPRRFVRR